MYIWRVPTIPGTKNMFFQIALFSALLLGIQCQSECDVSGFCTVSFFGMSNNTGFFSLLMISSVQSSSIIFSL